MLRIIAPLVLLVASPAAAQQPPPGEPTVQIPRSQSWSMTSEDGQRRYRLMLAVPAGKPPARGWPVIYVLDGNAFFATMTEAVRLEGFLARYEPAVVVGIGYDVEQPIDIVSRNFDYTPPTGPAPEFDDRNPHRLAGGGEQFARFLRDKVIPEIASRVAVDPARRALFGHSYGGLFATWAYIRHPGLFSDVIAASPSLWYKRSFVPHLAETRSPDLPLRGRLMLLVGENEQQPDPRELAMLGPERARALQDLKQVDNAIALAGTLKRHGAQAEAYVMPGETHASVVPGAISRAVRFFLKPAGIAADPAPAKAK